MALVKAELSLLPLYLSEPVKEMSNEHKDSGRKEGMFCLEFLTSFAHFMVDMEIINNATEQNLDK